VLRVLILAGLLAGGTSLAPAEDPGGSAERLAASAEEHIRKGEIFAAIEDLEKAVAADSDRLDLFLRLARLEKERGMWLRSAEHYRAILDVDPSLSEARLGHAELLLADYQFRAAAEQFRLLLEADLEHAVRDRALVGLGSSLFGVEEYAEALGIFRELHEDHPDNTTALAYMNIARRKQGDLEGAIQGWRLFLKQRPDVVRARVLLDEAEELRTAIARRRIALAQSAGEVSTRIELGDLLMEKPDLPGAIAAYEAALALKPGDPPILFRLGMARRDAGRCEDAIESFRRILADPALGGLAAYNLAHCARVEEDVKLEARAWDAALRANPRDAYAYRSYLDVLGRSGRIEKEIALLLKAVKERPRDPLPRIQYGILAAAFGKQEDAQRAFVDALSLEPNDPYARRELRQSLAGRPQDVERLLGEIDGAVERDGDEGTGLLRRASLLLAVDRAREAEALLERERQRRPDDARFAIALALCRRSAGAAPGEIEVLLREASRRWPDYLYAHLDLGVTLNALGRFEEAAQEATEALRIAPDNPNALTLLGASLRSRGGRANLEGAFAALKRAVQVDPMDSSGAARLLLAKVAWELGYERDARASLRGFLPVDPEEMYRIAWEFVGSHYRDRTFNGQDWRRWRTRFDGQLETRADALAAIALMLASLDDRATRLRSADQTATLFFTPRSTRIDRDRRGRTTMSSRTVESETLDENVGYLAVSNMADPKLVREVKGAMEEMKDRDGVILDLRGNPGGAERDVEQITSMMVPAGTPTGSVIDDEGVTETRSMGENPPILSDKPIVVLVDRNTASSAEVLAGSLKESNRAVVVGESTYGKAGIQVPRLLPDGTTLLVGTAESADLAGLSYSETGVGPDVHVGDARPREERDSDPAIRRAREILRKERERLREMPEKAPQP
jgi:C-terminal peptidase prc